jgi:hypothetical protein
VSNSRIVVLLTFALSHPVTAKPDSVGDVVHHTVPAVIRWVTYWEGPETLGSAYPAGEAFEARVLRTEKRLYVFLAPIHLEVDIWVSQPGLTVRSVGFTLLAMNTNERAVKKFLESWQQASPGCFGKDQKFPLGRGATHRDGEVPLLRPCPQQEDIVGDETVSIKLPELGPPDAIRRRIVPSDKNELAAAVRAYIASRPVSCRSAIARFPFYSNTDPRVYVLVDSAGVCPQGVAVFSRSVRSRWEFGQFLADVPAEQLGNVISRIRMNTAETVRDN